MGLLIPKTRLNVHYQQLSTRRYWTEKVNYPTDGVLRNKKLRISVILDGGLSWNGGKDILVDADKGIQIDYRLGSVSIPHTIETGEVEEVTDAKTGLVTTRPKTITKLEVVETREWVGIPGITTWINEQDLSFKQAAMANQDELMKTIRTVLVVNMVIMLGNMILMFILGGQLFDIMKDTGRL